MNKFLKNIVLIIVSIFVALLIAEGAARLVFDPIDFLKPVTVRDEILGRKIEPGSGAHDDWGFRNKDLPETAHIVAIGDSQTYGYSATASNSWPSQLESLSGKKVYNMSLGGYGPAEYLYLMENTALKLSPDIIVAGFYLGNDLRNSYRSVYTVPIWEVMRDPKFSSALPDSLSDKKTNNSIKLGKWLSEHSVLYRLASSSFIGDHMRQQRRISEGEEIVMVSDEENGIKTGLTPNWRLPSLETDDPEVVEGLRLSLELINEMNTLSLQHRIRFLVVIIPTKESVFSGFVGQVENIPAKERVERLISREKKVNGIVKQYFYKNGIEYIDVLDVLQESVFKEQVYPINFGGHPNKNGYRIIAETINGRLGID